MNGDQIFTSKHGEPFVSVFIEKYYTDKDGNVFKKQKGAKDPGPKHDSHAKFEMQIHIPDYIDSLENEFAKLAGLHSLGRKGAEYFSTSDPANYQTDTDGFTLVGDALGIYEGRLKKEKSEKTEKEPTMDGAVIASLKWNMSKKGREACEVDGIVMKFTKTGKVDWLATAKEVSKEHAYYKKVKKLVEKEIL
jgi:hypothetical protein